MLDTLGLTLDRVEERRRMRGCLAGGRPAGHGAGSPGIPSGGAGEGASCSRARLAGGSTAASSTSVRHVLGTPIVVPPSSSLVSVPVLDAPVAAAADSSKLPGGEEGGGGLAARAQSEVGRRSMHACAPCGGQRN